VLLSKLVFILKNTPFLSNHLMYELNHTVFPANRWPCCNAIPWPESMYKVVCNNHGLPMKAQRLISNGVLDIYLLEYTI
jgi:hypothetical protein